MPVIAAMRKLGTMYSIGMITSFPYTKLNGVFPVSLLQVVQWNIQILVIMVPVTYLCECMLQHLVELLHCPIYLWMIWVTLLMLYMKFLCQCVDRATNEVTPLVSHQYHWKPKPSNNFVKQEPHCYRSSAIYNRCGLIPSCQIVCRCNYAPRIGLFPGGLIGPTKSKSHLSNGYSVT